MIAIIPAAGKAERMMGLPKFLLPVPGGKLIDVLAQRMLYARKVYLYIGSTGAPHEYLCSLGWRSVDVGSTETMSETVLALRRDTLLWDEGSATHFVDKNNPDNATLFGMPDTYFDDDQAFVKLSKALDDGADVAVGTFLTRYDQHAKVGMCAVSGDRVMQVVDKPQRTALSLCWGVLAWKPKFWDFIKPEQPHVGYALQPAIDAGLDVRNVPMTGYYFDCGTPDEYFTCIRYLTEDKCLP